MLPRSLQIKFTVALSVVGCQVALGMGLPAPDPRQQPAIDDDVRAMFAKISADLQESGPLGWLNHFADDDRFFMASDGKVVFPDRQRADAFVRGFAPSVEKVKLDWSDVRVEIIDEDHALVAAAYDEVIAETTGGKKEFSGFFSGLAVRQQGSWKLRHLHWSSPRSDAQ